MSEEQNIKPQPTESENESTSKLERLIQEIADTNQFLRRAFSFRMIIIRGLLSGFAFVLGSTVLVSLIISASAIIFGDATTLRELFDKVQ